MIMAITVYPVTPSFAAEIGDVDLARPIDSTDLQAIKDAFTQHAVLIFPDQHLSQDQHLEIPTARCGARKADSACSNWVTGFGTPIARSNGCLHGHRCFMRARSRQSADIPNLPMSVRPTMRFPRR